MRVFGITGSIAAGKTSVTDMLAAHWPVVDADLVSREVVAPGSLGLAQVAAAFGPEVLDASGALNRTYLRGLIAESGEAQQRLNGILHPLIIAAIKDKLAALQAAGHTVAFVSAALMLETGSYRNYDGVVLVTADEEVRLARLLRRDGMDEAAARKLMARQMPEAEKRRFARVVIANDGNLDDLRRETAAALAELGLAFS